MCVVSDKEPQLVMLFTKELYYIFGIKIVLLIA